MNDIYLAEVESGLVFPPKNREGCRTSGDTDSVGQYEKEIKQHTNQI